MTTNLSARELLNRGDVDREKPFINKYWPQTLGVIMGIGTGVTMNFNTRRPAFSGIQKHVVAVIGFTALCIALEEKRISYNNEKDAVLRHYIDIHPEFFEPVPERKKIGHILEPWIPVR